MRTARALAVGVVGAAGCLLVGWAGDERLAPRLLFNTTASAPLGFYRLTPGRYAVGELAAVAPPPPLARWMALRGYLPANVPLLKEVAAVSGQAVCARHGVILIEGVVVARTRTHDRQGRALPAFHGCGRLAADQAFLLNAAAPNSLDSRYFGPVSTRQILGGALPLWTWEARP